jgi:hypothetical protein
MRPGTLPHLLRALILRADAAAVVTGTPATSRPLDAFAACDALTSGGVFGVEGAAKPIGGGPWAAEQAWQARRAAFKRHNCYSHADTREPFRPVPVKLNQ